MSNTHTSQTSATPLLAGARDTVLPQRLPSRRRWFMLSLLLIATIINYIDRVNISIAAPFMAKDLGLDKIEMGLIFPRSPGPTRWLWCRPGLLPTASVPVSPTVSR